MSTIGVHKLQLVNYYIYSLVRIVRRQSKSQAGNIMPALNFRVDGRQSHPLHRSFVRSSVKQNSSRIFLMSLKGIGASSRSPSCSLSLTQTLKELTLSMTLIDIYILDSFVYSIVIMISISIITFSSIQDPSVNTFG